MRLGDTVRFRFTNRGKVIHDAHLGTAAAHAQHDAGGHAAAEVTVAPDQADDLTYTFATDDPVTIICHQPGHQDAGMTIQVTVET